MLDLMFITSKLCWIKSSAKTHFGTLFRYWRNWELLGMNDLNKDGGSKRCRCCMCILIKCMVIWTNCSNGPLCTIALVSCNKIHCQIASYQFTCLIVLIAWWSFFSFLHLAGRDRRRSRSYSPYWSRRRDRSRSRTRSRSRSRGRRDRSYSPYARDSHRRRRERSSSRTSDRKSN